MVAPASNAKTESIRNIDAHVVDLSQRFFRLALTPNGRRPECMQGSRPLRLDTQPVNTNRRLKSK
jgi:hypothetical protein